MRVKRSAEVRARRAEIQRRLKGYRKLRLGAPPGSIRKADGSKSGGIFR